jgi:16S rRNA processing protein RimM
VVGRVVKAHGLRGEVVVDVLSDVPDRLAAGVSVHLDGLPVEIVASRPHQGRLLVTFDGVRDRTEAERLRGRALEAEPLDLDDAEAYFVHQLVGMAVRAADGRDLGTVTAAVELPDAAGYDLLEVRRPDGGSWLLPAVDEYVEVVADPDGREALLVVDPPAGLLDDAVAPGDVPLDDADTPGDVPLDDADTGDAAAPDDVP